MSAPTDIKAISRSTSGLFVGGRNRLKGIYVESPADSAGFIDIHDGLTQAGLPKLSFDLANADTASAQLPGAGILFEKGIYLFISGENAPNITIYYG